LTVGGVLARLYYVSPTQLNVQIPYEVPTNRTVAVVVSNNKQTGSININVSAAAPEIFTDSDGSLVQTHSAARGEIVTLYFTGAGAVQPAVATGATPSSGQTPVPTDSTLVTVRGEKASMTYIGVPS
jgi:uncharacterized protein (TIGR03437 family)